jgi:hypothetical protein
MCQPTQDFGLRKFLFLKRNYIWYENCYNIKASCHNINHQTGEMKMKNKLTLLLATALLSTATMSYAAQVNIDFRGYTPGTALSVVDGVTFTVTGGPGPSGTPVIDNWGSNGLSNSTTGEYPTGAILDIAFGGNARDVRFNVDNYGGSGSYYSAFDIFGNLLETGIFGSNGGGDFSLASTNIANLQLNNNTLGFSNWLFTLTTLDADVTARSTDVPEPATFALFGLGLAGISVLRRNRKV